MTIIKRLKKRLKPAAIAAIKKYSCKRLLLGGGYDMPSRYRVAQGTVVSGSDKNEATPIGQYVLPDMIGKFMLRYLSGRAIYPERQWVTPALREFLTCLLSWRWSGS